MTALYNKVVILTGASQGIGRAAAYKFIEAGCKVALIARSEKALTQLAAEFGESNAIPIPADLNQPGSCPRIVAQTISHFGRVDILVNNAAVGVYGPGETVSRADMQQVMQVNFLAPLQLMQACIPQMRTGGGGLIINVSSIIGRRATPWAGGYCAAKAALERMVESMRVELAPDNIHFSTLYPGVTQTGFGQNSLGNRRQLRGRVKGVPPEKVAAKLIRIVETAPRDAYVTLFDRAYVTGSQIAPRLIDWAFEQYFKHSDKGK